MTTLVTNTRVRHDSDVEFRLWGKELSDSLAAVGLVKTTDTGQINWATVFRPTVAGTAAGYEIWRFKDSALQTAQPIFIKIEYGSAGVSQASAGIWITVGAGSDGAGNITTITITRRATGASSSQAMPNNDTTWASYFCHTDDFLGVITKSGLFTLSTQQAALIAFALYRTCDANGNATADGYHLMYGNAQSASAFFGTVWRTSPAYSSGFFNGANTIIYGYNTANIGNDAQLWPVVGIKPEPILTNGLCVVPSAGLTIPTTFNATPVGTRQRTYAAMSFPFHYPTQQFTNNTVQWAMVWE